MKILDVFQKGRLNQIVKPYIIAEAGVNHEGQMDLAKRLVEEAAEGGAHAIKFQTYKAEKIASKDSPSYWDTEQEPTESQYQLFKKYDKFWKEEFEQLKLVCDEFEIEFLSTPFDVESATFLNDLMDVFKISSSDITNKPFIEYLSAFKKPIILSTGASDLGEIQDAVNWIAKSGNPLALLHCVLNYPTEDQHAHLGMIKGLKNEFPDHIVGYSDHTLPKDMKSLEIATILGSQILEKHFTHDKSLPGNDHYHAMDREDLKLFNQSIERVLSLIDNHQVVALDSEEPARKNARRSLVAARDIPEGKVIEQHDLTFKRPAHGISPKFIDQVIGKKANRFIMEDEILQWSSVENSND